MGLTSIRMLKIPKTTTTTLVLLILAAAYATAQSPPLRPPIPPCMPEFPAMENKAASAQGARRVAVGDIDGDGTVDLVSASSGDHTIAWYPNIDGKGTFSSVTSVTTTAMGAWDVIVVDIDGDSDLDLASASFVDNTIAWYNNTDGAGTFSNAIVVTSAANGASAVLAVDMDADGDLDILSASEADNTVAWYENMDGMGSFGPRLAISTDIAGVSVDHKCELASTVIGPHKSNLLPTSIPYTSNLLPTSIHTRQTFCRSPLPTRQTLTRSPSIHVKPFADLHSIRIKP